jgi:hypothetical protein
MAIQKVESYLGNANVKRDGVSQDWTKEDILEYQKCMGDSIYFAETYCKVISLDDGLVPFKLYDYQKQMFNHFNDNRFSIVLACRQSGKSISTVAYLLWFALFHSEQTIAILANKGSTAREMLSRITLMLENLPFFLQPGTKALNKGSIEFSNNSRLIAAATSGSSIRGMSINLLYLDEFAFVENATEFYTSTYPVVSAGKKTKVIITSTANGLGNIYQKIYEGALQKTNEFKAFRVDWWDVPGRDAEWKRMTVSNTSELQFDQEFGNNFHGTGNTLINAETLLSLKAVDPIYVLNNASIFEDPVDAHDYLVFVDVAKGRGMDYSTFNIIDVTEKPFKQVATFRDNRISPLLFPDIIFKYATHYNEAYVIVESNDQGAVVCNGLYYDLEYENVFVESYTKANSVGVTMTKKVKRIGCTSLKDIMEQGKLTIVDIYTIQELSTFISRGSSFEADHGNHDDLVMNLVLFAYFTTTPFFADTTDINMKGLLYADRVAAIEAEVIPVGNFHSDDDTLHPEGPHWVVWKGI